MSFRTVRSRRALALIVVALSALVPSAAKQARADVYVYSQQSTSNYTFTGGTPAAPTNTVSQDQASLGGTTTAIGASVDAALAYRGPVGGQPAENSFSTKGQTTPDYARGD